METVLTPLLTLDLKKRRIRVHRQTLQLLNEPKYIQLLVNPDTKIIALQSQKEKTSLSHRVAYNKGHHNFELYSGELLLQLQRVNAFLTAGNTYRIAGHIYPQRGLAVFHLEDSTPIDEPLP